MQLNFKTTKDIKVPTELWKQVLGQDQAIQIIRKAAKQRRHVLLIGEPGCLIGDERVFQSNGAILKISDFGTTHLEKIKKSVMIGSGHKTALASVFHTYKNQPTMEIVTESGKSIKGTHNHPILIVEKKQGFTGGSSTRRWKRLDEIKEGERVAVVSGVRCTIKKYIKTNFSNISRKKMGPKFHGKLPIKVTPDIAALFGYIIGDGWVNSKKERLGFVVAEDEKDILKKTISFVEKNFSITPRHYKRVRQDRNMPLHYIEINNQNIYHNLKFLQEKRIPDLILRSGNKVAASFLKWLFTADGTVYNKGRGRRGIALKSKNLELLRDVQTMLLRFGIFSNIATIYGKSKHSDLQLHIRRGYDIIKFHKKIGFACRKKIKVLNSLAADAIKFARVRKQIGEKVVKVIKEGYADVFDIEVPEGHRFVANGIISHNTGKSLTGQALAELLPKERLVDILSINNPQDENIPVIKTVQRGKGKELINKLRLRLSNSFKYQNLVFFILVLLTMITPWWIRKEYGDIMAAASLLGSMMFLAIFMLFINLNKRVKLVSGNGAIPKLLIDNSDKQKAPFIDASGTHAGALLGDVLHDPLQTGGLGTPAYERLVPGMIHRANGGVLFVDEIGNLQPHSQQELLTAMQEKKYPITGQSERSSGAMVRSNPVPCDFVLVAAGTVETIKKMHPALRSRIRGYGYEVHMNSIIDDTQENCDKIAVFIAQEVAKDKKIPPFSRAAVLAIIEEAKKRAGRAGKLTLRLRELGGLLRAAGDLALEEKAKVVETKHVIAAKTLAKTLEQQIVDKYIEDKKAYDVILVKGNIIGRVNGLAVMGSQGYFSGLVLPIESEVTIGGKKSEFIATGRLGEIAKEAVKNVSAIILKYFGEDIKEKYDIFVQFLQTAGEGVEGDSASIAVATAIKTCQSGKIQHLLVPYQFAEKF
ncbi:ATP-dependent protease LonB [Candidatus Woesearchaeota archaeon]|nr:ATP-dependent protease LonB [Candidatus Woesearchaeota archaeon]